MRPVTVVQATMSHVDMGLFDPKDRAAVKKFRSAGPAWTFLNEGGFPCAMGGFTKIGDFAYDVWFILVKDCPAAVPRLAKELVKQFLSRPDCYRVHALVPLDSRMKRFAEYAGLTHEEGLARYAGPGGCNMLLLAAYGVNAISPERRLVIPGLRKGA